MVELHSEDLYDPEKVKDVNNAYFARSTSGCKIIHYEYDNKWQKRLSQISFSKREIDPVKCVLTFKKIAAKYGEGIPYEKDARPFTNGVYTYFKRAYNGYVTVLDMNSAYLWALSQPLADANSRTEVSIDQVYSKEFDFYCFENSLHREMYYKEDQERMLGSMLWADVKIYGYKSKLYYQKTAKELYRLKCDVDKERYKNVANIAVGCMHKRSGKQNNTTIAASLYAWFAWYIDNLVVKFEKKGYNVIMITTDSIKIQGQYNMNDNLIPIGNGLGEFKVEYEGEAKYFSEGHYKESSEKWKGKPLYMIDGFTKCEFVNNIEKEKKIYEKYAIC